LCFFRSYTAYYLMEGTAYSAHQSTDVLTSTAGVARRVPSSRFRNPREKRRFWLVVASLVLSDFLVALDMVRLLFSKPM
jgi:predicted tellurium resistance membrane protein TerC